jgi:hypothetical protein
MVRGVETSCHTRLPSLNYAGSNAQPSVITHHSLQAPPPNRIQAPPPEFEQLHAGFDVGFAQVDIETTELLC